MVESPTDGTTDWRLPVGHRAVVALSTSAPAAAASAAPTLGEELANLRLAHRAERLERVLAALCVRYRQRLRGGPPPERLVQAINDYSRELAHVRAGLPPTFLAREAAAVAALPVNAGDQRRRGAAMTVSAYATRARAGSPGCRDAADRPAYDIGAPVYCEDRPVGKLGRVVVDLIRRAVTHLTVSAG